MLSLIAYIIAALLFFLVGIDEPITDHPVEWGLFFVALGLALQGVQLPRRTP